MRDLLTSGRIGTVETEAQKKIRQESVARWEGLGLLEGMNGHLKETIATLYENQARHLITENTSANSAGSFETVVFPLVRRVFSKLLANDIVSVQALNMPIGKLFHIVPKTSERSWYMADGTELQGKPEDGSYGRHEGLMGYTRQHRNLETTGVKDKKVKDGLKDANGVEGTENRFHLPDEVIIPNEKARVTQFMKKNLYDLFYNDFLFDNSKGRAVVRVGAETSFIRMTPAGPEEIQAADLVATDTDGSVRKVIVKVKGFASHNVGRITGPDGNEMDTESFLASLKIVTKKAIDGGDKFASFAEGEAIPLNLIPQQYGRGIVSYKNICQADGELYVELSFQQTVQKAGVSIDGFIGIDPAKAAELELEAAWIQYDSLEFETEIGEVSFDITGVVVSVEERKLRATWSPELAQDVSAYHNIDAEAELTALLSQQIASEVDREILRDLRKAAPWQIDWDYSGWQRRGTTSTNYTQKDWNQELISAVNRISAQIQKSTLQGGANFIIVSSEIGALLNDLEYFHVTDASAESEQYNLGIEKIGSLQGRYQVIVDPYAPHWSLLMGHHGTSILDTGYVYAPYVPLVLTPTITNPHNGVPVKYIMTRYAKKLVNNRFYGAVRVHNLHRWSTDLLR